MAKKSATPTETPTTLRIRRAPKFLPFMSIGTIFGLVLALVLSSLIPAEAQGGTSILGVLLVYLGGAGFMSGTLMALGFDWISRTRSKEVEATKLKG